ncbi:tryptophan 2-monooxygenase [Streptomyces sp. KhCrAH-43]|uniref:metal-dependent hydrolase family protein n=1 Tax=unclassified Streptomyces TaxID=2593676 RepID=UPI00036F7283|nr:MULTISPECIES: amidohydrolase family protein [unclassified Streptomyces]MYS36771.1 amidohydrolase family protein [Streptomyces sp. SID4920]MYX69242.1 amidohydrolase family protein [Streptomyces sp. SID8373]RAJ62093.1 tryptophan 2-monooxygenase [Streptomyces sp. KhCrAH-43]
MSSKALTVLVADRFWDGVADKPSGRTEVAVRDGRITQIGTRITRQGDGIEVVELGDRLLMPGLIDCHVHTTIDPGRMVAAFTTDGSAQIALHSLPVLRDFLDRGFTTVRDLGTFSEEPITLYLRNAVKAGLITGPRMIVAPHLISARGAHGDVTTAVSPRFHQEIGVLADGPDEVTRVVREDIRSGADWIKFGATGGFATPSDDPTQVTFSQDEMNALVTTARDLGIPCTPHAYGDEGVSRAVTAGVRSVEHGNLASAKTLKLIEERGVFLVPTQFLVLDALDNLDNDAYWSGKDPAERVKFTRYADQLRDSASNVAASDVKLAFGTDAGMFPHSENWREFTSMIQSGISELRALKAATSVAADLLDRPDLGNLRPGAIADLVAMPGNAFDDITAVTGIDFVMQAGTVHRRPDA